MQKKYIIAGNWKMQKTVEESIDFFKDLDNKIAGNPAYEQDNRVEILVFPPFTSLYSLKDISSKIKAGSQNIFYEEKGAFTGEISPLMLQNIVTYTLIGHSERRHIFGEADINLNKKIKTALKFGFTPMLCIGETLEEREAGNTFAKISEQIEQDLEGLSRNDISRITLAYEPVWAIGTGKTATPEQAQEVHAYIRALLKEKTDSYEDIPLLYGGSVKPENSYAILSQKDINGVLIGGASLQVDAFFAIISSSYKIVAQ
jgi:triosephosphate isomerase